MTICTKEIFLSINGVEILKNVSLEINEGEILTILGPNGAGKVNFNKFLFYEIRSSA